MPASPLRRADPESLEAQDEQQKIPGADPRDCSLMARSRRAIATPVGYAFETVPKSASAGLGR